MKKYFVLFLLVSILFIGCSDKNVNGPVITNDSELSSNIIGTWSNETYKITFLSDLTFRDTLYTQDKNTLITKPLYARSGKYEIQNSILYLETEHWYFIDPAFVGNGISIIPFENEIKISGNILYNKSVDVLQRTEGSGNEIWGKWKEVKWTYEQSSPDTNTNYEGREEYYYNFYKDSSKVTFGWKYMDGNPFPNAEFRSDFSYSPPTLNIIVPGYYNWTVEFKYGNMYWYPPLNGVELYKQN